LPKVWIDGSLFREGLVEIVGLIGRPTPCESFQIIVCIHPPLSGSYPEPFLEQAHDRFCQASTGLLGFLAQFCRKLRGEIPQSYDLHGIDASPLLRDASK